MIVHRAFPARAGARVRQAGGPLWFPRALQGAGRHDNPDVYGCIYVAEDAVSCVAEALAPFRGTGRLLPEMLRRAGRPLALASLALSEEVSVVDLDEPRVLVRERLRPSQVATSERARTQQQAARLHARHRQAVGLRWWSVLEASWRNVTLFDRALPRLSVREVRELTVEDEIVEAAGDFLGLTAARGPG